MLYWQMWPRSKVALLGAQALCWGQVQGQKARLSFHIRHLGLTSSCLNLSAVDLPSFFLQATLRNNCTVVTQHIVTIVQHLIGIGGVHIDVLECVCYVTSSGNNIRNTKTKRKNHNRIKYRELKLLLHNFEYCFCHISIIS